MEHGIDQVRPLGPRTVVDAIDVHQATVSRVTSNTYMQTPREVFELKYFFTVASASSQGGDVLSDDDIVVRPKERAIDLRAAPSQNIAKR